MSSISSVSNFDPQSLLATIKPSTTVSNDGDSDDSGVTSTATSSGQVRHAGHGGHMGRALMETFQQLGLTGNASSSTSTSSSDAGKTSDTSSSDANQNGLAGDLAAFMSQLFQAMRSQVDASSNGANGNSSNDSGKGSGRLDNALASLSTAAANGTAPDGLQSAYQQLLSDLQGSSSTTSSGTPSLQSFLTALQQNLGQAPQNMAVGNVISTQA